MAKIILPIIIHGVTGRMGKIALRAIQTIAAENWAKVGKDVIEPVPIGLARNPEKLAHVAQSKGMEHYFTDFNKAYDFAKKLNPQNQVYHNTLSTGIRKDIFLNVVSQLNPATTSVYMEKPLAANYAEGFDMVDAIEKNNFLHGVVHHMLATPGVLKARELMPRIKPLSATMAFGYEVGPGLSDNNEFSGQRPDFNWTFKEAGGGIILDMCHEGYLSKALFGPTERLSASARLIVPKRRSTDGTTIIDCDVEDYAAIRREHENGVINTSLWSWYRRVNSEFGPLEITVEGEGGSMVFGLYGIKVQMKETAPANRWEKSVSGEKTEWRDYWEYLDVPYKDPFALELADYLVCVMEGKKYPKDAVQALNVLGEVEALYKSAANNGAVVEKDSFYHYPKSVSQDWAPERLQNGKLKVLKN
jgi:predicted dehydrogenase